MARASRLPLVVAVLALAACGGGNGGETSKPADSPCPTTGKQVKFPILDPATTYTVDVRTNLGSFAFRLNVEDSPCTTSSFASLVRKRFFDGTRFHRIVPGFVIQGGDPTATGSGGPGYTVVDTPPQNAAYTRGVVLRIGRLGNPADEQPTRRIVVQRMTVTP